MRSLLLLVLMFASLTGHAEIIGQDVSYKSGDTNLKGYLAYDDSIKNKRPGVLVVHEWWGHNDYARKRAEMLAELGYTALALDMYGDGKQASHPKEAGAFAGQVRKNIGVAKERFLAAKQLLASHHSVDASKIAAIGYCFGGAIVLEMARLGVDLKAVASFHGSLGTSNPAKAGQVNAKLLVMNGADDQFVSAEQITAFKQEMTAAGVDYKFINYPGAVHAFTNPAATDLGKQFNIPLAYNKVADQKSWAEMRDFLSSALK